MNGETKCVFVIAMEKEALPILKNIEIEEDYSYCGKHVISGKLFNKPVSVVICGVGKVNAGCGAQIAVDLLKAYTVVNIGVAGGLNGGLTVGEIYAVSEVVQYDFDLTQLNGTEIGTLDECDKNYLPLTLLDGKFTAKRCATGDRFNDSKEDYNLLTQTLKADVRDMELGAIAQTCMHAGVKCVAFKIISDLAGSGSTTEQYLKNLTLCFTTLEKNLKELTDKIYG